MHLTGSEVLILPVARHPTWPRCSVCSEALRSVGQQRSPYSAMSSDRSLQRTGRLRRRRLQRQLPIVASHGAEMKGAQRRFREELPSFASREDDVSEVRRVDNATPIDVRYPIARAKSDTPKSQWAHHNDTLLILQQQGAL